MGLLYLYPLNRRLSGPPRASRGFLRREEFLTSVGIRTPNSSLVIIRTTRGVVETVTPCVRFHLNSLVQMTYVTGQLDGKC